MTPTGVDHVVLEVHDVERSLAFYCGILGLTPERADLFREGQVPFASARAGGALIDLFPAENPSDGPPHFCLAFQEPIDAIVQELAARGLQVEPPESRYGAQGAGDSVYVQDPDGHVVEIRSYTSK